MDKLLSNRLEGFKRCGREKRSVHMSRWNSLGKTVSKCMNLVCEEFLENMQKSNRVKAKGKK